MARDRRILLSLAMPALLAAFLLPVAAAQGTPTLDEFKLPDGATSIDAMCLDSSVNVWLAQSSPPHALQVRPVGGHVPEA